MNTYDAIRISCNHTSQKHYMQSRITTKTVPENAFMVLCLQEQSCMTDDEMSAGNCNRGNSIIQGRLHKG